jgi:hypothetical protein
MISLRWLNGKPRRARPAGTGGDRTSLRVEGLETREVPASGWTGAVVPTLNAVASVQVGSPQLMTDEGSYRTVANQGRPGAIVVLAMGNEPLTAASTGAGRAYHQTRTIFDLDYSGPDRDEFAAHAAPVTPIHALHEAEHGVVGAAGSEHTVVRLVLPVPGHILASVVVEVEAPLKAEGAAEAPTHGAAVAQGLAGVALADLQNLVMLLAPVAPVPAMLDGFRPAQPAQAAAANPATVPMMEINAPGREPTAAPADSGSVNWRAGLNPAPELLSAPWLAELLTPSTSLASTPPLLLLQQFVRQAEGWGGMLAGALRTVLAAPWASVTAVALAAAAASSCCSRRAGRERGRAIDVPEITAPGELT